MIQQEGDAALEAAALIDDIPAEFMRNAASVTVLLSSSTSAGFRPSDDLRCNFVKTAGKRLHSELLYTIGEEQFYKRNKLLKDGRTAYVCRRDRCNRRLYLTPDGICKFSAPYTPHDHSACGAEFDKLSLVNRMKAECEKIAPTSPATKRSKIKENLRERH